MASQRERGGLQIGTVVFLLLIAGGIYSAFVYIPPWMAYRALQDRMVDLAHESATISDAEIVNRLVIETRAWNLPVPCDRTLTLPPDISALSDEELVNRLALQAQPLNAPMNCAAIQVNRADNRIQIHMQWDVILIHFGLWYQRLHFEPTVDEVISPGGA